MRLFTNALVLFFLCLFPMMATAADTTINQANTAWLLTATALVLFMTIPGLALFYGGLVRSKNVLSVLMQCFTITCLASVIWFIFGYSLAFGDGGGVQKLVGSFEKAFFWGIGANKNLDLDGNVIPELLFAAFQMTFAIITPALVVGGFAERMKFSAMLWFSAFWLIVVYIPVCHWVWGNGWLYDLGFWDFAGGTVVHVNAGVAALVAALVLGRRRGFPQTPMPPHNMTMAVTGAAMLWVGWFGFNAGSALAADGGAAMALMVTHLGASTGALAWMVVEWKRFGKPSVLGIVTGMVAGLGTITPASGYVGPVGAVVIGTLAGVVCFYATQIIKRVLKIDDSLDVFPVHGIGGILGTALAVLGLFWDGRHTTDLASGKITFISKFGIQLLGICATIVWCAVFTWLILKLVDVLVGLRVGPEDETEGLDIVLHEEKGYNL